MGREPQEAHEEASEEGSKAMSVRLTKEQAKKCYQALDDAFEGHVEEFSAVANALIEMGVVALPPNAEPDPYAEAKARAAKWGARLLKCNNGRYIFATDTAWWGRGAWDRRTDSLGQSDAIISKSFHGIFSTEAEALSNFPTVPPPGYVEPKPPAPGPTSEELFLENERAIAALAARINALEAKANRPASEPFVPEQVTRAKLNATSLYEISQCANALENLSRAVGDVTTRHMETQTYWAKKLRELVDRHMRHGADVVVEAMKPDPKPTPSLIEACAEAALEAVFPGMPWGDRVESTKKEYRASATAAITRFLEEPVSHEEIDQACDAYLLVNGQQSGVRVNLGRMDAALAASRRVLLDRVKGGKHD